MRHAVALFVLTACSVAALPAAAQDIEDDPILDDEMQTGSRFLLEPETAEAQEARYLQKRVANCVYNRDEERVRELLVNSDFFQIHFDDMDLTPDTFGDEFDIDYCIGRAMQRRYRHLGMRYQLNSMRNLLAEEVYLGDFGVPPIVDTETRRRMPLRFGDRRPHPQVSGMADIADCIVYSSPQMAHNLLSARPGSENEIASVNGLAASFESCSNSDEEEITVSTSMLRQIVADGMWARSTFGQPPAGTPTVSIQSDAQSAAENGRTLDQELAECIHRNNPQAGRELTDSSDVDEFGRVLEAILPLCPTSGTINITAVQAALRELDDTAAGKGAE